MPFGKYRGVRIRLLPDNYLSWLTTSAIMTNPQWWWLRESLIAELKYRDMRWDLAPTPDPPEPPALPKRAIRLED